MKSYRTNSSTLFLTDAECQSLLKPPDLTYYVRHPSTPRHLGSSPSLDHPNKKHNLRSNPSPLAASKSLQSMQTSAVHARRARAPTQTNPPTHLCPSSLTIQALSRFTRPPPNFRLSPHRWAILIWGVGKVKMRKANQSYSSIVRKRHKYHYYYYINTKKRPRRPPPSQPSYAPPFTISSRDPAH